MLTLKAFLYSYHFVFVLNVTALNLNTRSPTRKEMNLWLPSSGSSPGGAIE